MRTSPILAAGLLTGLCHASPAQVVAPKVNRPVLAQKAYLADLAVLQSCQAQSCSLADASGSSGRPPTVMPRGANDDDLKCVFKYNKEVEEIIKQAKAAGTPIPQGPIQDTGLSTDLFQALDGWQRPSERTIGELDKGTFEGQCRKNILIFSKGTLEPFPYGVTIGPQLSIGWDDTWSVNPVIYDPTVAGDFCLALPGGMVAKDLINQAAAKCPSSNIYVAGYSQGAMVVRNGVAYADPAARARVKGVVTFGDPFNGAPIKGYTGPIKTYCTMTDGVCGGNFELGFAHVAYPFDGTVADAKAYLTHLAANTA